MKRVNKMRKRAQGAFEYVLLLGGVLLIVLFIAVVLRQSYGATGGQLNQTVAAAIQAAWLNVTPTPMVAGANCTGGYEHGKCLTSYPPKYCEFGVIKDNCQKCGCPANLSCTAAGTCLAPTAVPAAPPTVPTIYSPTPALAPTPTPSPVPSLLEPLAFVGAAVDSLVAGIFGIGTEITKFLVGIGRFGWVIGLAVVLVLVAALVYYLARARK